MTSLKPDLSALVKDLETHLALATAERPVVLFLDSLDQLSIESGAREVRIQGTRAHTLPFSFSLSITRPNFYIHLPTASLAAKGAP